MCRALLILSVLAALPLPVHSQRIRARVIDADRRTPLEAVRIGVIDSSGVERDSARTDRDGFFTMADLARGSYTLVAELDGYRALHQPLVIRSSDPLTLPALLLQSDAVPLDPVQAEASAQARPQFRERDEIRPEFLLAGSRMAELEKVNASPAAVYRELGLRVRESVTDGGRLFCVQNRRGPNSMRGGGGSSCEPLAVIVDGMLIGDPTLVLRELKVNAWESIEYLSAIEAAMRFGLHGSASGGAIVLWTRGSGPHRSTSRNGDSNLREPSH
ncbi:MAG TPA: carboxypeptidase-like regulatory domain-containing protein [Longimicrobiales bacterium]